MTGSSSARWPDLPYDAWSGTCEALHLWLQLLGKIELALLPRMNQYWQSSLRVTARGIATRTMPCGQRNLDIELDLITHALYFRLSDGQQAQIPLGAMSMAAFYTQVQRTLSDLGLQVPIWPHASEMPDPVPFLEDHLERPYDATYAQRYWTVLIQCQRVFGRYRAGFQGKSSGVNLYWGGMDLTVTRFSGQTAPPHPPSPLLPDRVIADSYSHEECSVGFWPGSASAPYAAFFAYIYPEPTDYKTSGVRPADARYDEALSEFVLPYQAVSRSASPDEDLLTFCQTTYEAAARHAGWDRAALEYRPT